jgi:hypothetical protein
MVSFAAISFGEEDFSKVSRFLSFSFFPSAGDGT